MYKLKARSVPGEKGLVPRKNLKLKASNVTQNIASKVGASVSTSRPNLSYREDQLSHSQLVEFVFKLGRGFYSWATVDQSSILLIQGLQAVLDPKSLEALSIKYDNATEFHSTLVHARTTEQVDVKAVSKAIVRGLQDTSILSSLPTLWIDHRGRDILVLELDAPGLVAFNQELVAAGIVHSYEGYVPHITLGKLGTAEPLTDAQRVAFQRGARQVWSTLLDDDSCSLELNKEVLFSLCC